MLTIRDPEDRAYALISGNMLLEIGGEKYQAKNSKNILLFVMSLDGYHVIMRTMKLF